MKVYFIGAGPGAADLITLRGIQILKEVPMVMYAGSLVNREFLMHCQEALKVIDTAVLNLEEQETYYKLARQNEWDVARLHSGDPAIYGTIAEQIVRLRQLGIPFEVVPGVSSFSASAACLQKELTKPRVSQTVILTRVSGRASPVPQKESLSRLAAHQATLCIFLSGPHLPEIVKELRQFYTGNTPIALVQKATWPEERIHLSTLGNVLDEIKVREWALSTMVLVGSVLGEELEEESQLYSARYTHRFRRGYQSGRSNVGVERFPPGRTNNTVGAKKK